MVFLSIAVKILSILAFIFFVVFSYFCLLWTERDKKERENIFIGTMVSLLYTFKFFSIGFFLIFIISFFLDKPF
ncbi:hypothetical protein COY61_01405 [bacterium (Candidatus Gribaldobacteria) CG_4_10_14_0_8_um_filter_33_9]|uniref:Uncharacterized protein n=1 Tax=bacterium (Candidatus Gribaldobacteria) CG_4_10_14_0_8_um_filter_33_9 TaxID=2014266 RepID=A0A2M7RMY6_9BACT|nr:MAG: hypothetical protein COY61_01405 [bacterium (Candidatus Gribaldobacteria) CG_4_10_14_0_8_um_filter_33_9]